MLNILVDAFESDELAAEYIQGLTSYTGKSGLVTKAKDSGNFSIPLGIWEIKAGEPVPLE